MNKSDWLLIVLNLGKSLSPVQLQKSLFLISKEIIIEREEEFYDFEPYDYGPFDSNIYKDAENLEKEGLIKIENPFERSHRYYCITEDGSNHLNRILSFMDKKELAKASDIVSLVKSLSFPSLIKMIYNKYPEFKVKSIFQN
jgi:uncharacterized protein